MSHHILSPPDCWRGCEAHCLSTQRHRTDGELWGEIAGRLDRRPTGPPPSVSDKAPSPRRSATLPSEAAADRQSLRDISTEPAANRGPLPAPAARQRAFLFYLLIHANRHQRPFPLLASAGGTEALGKDKERRLSASKAAVCDRRRRTRRRIHGH